MAIEDPVALCAVASRSLAESLCQLLGQADIQTSISHDLPLADAKGERPAPGEESVTIWVAQSQAMQAWAVIKEYAREEEESHGGEPIPAVCDECGRQTVFPPSLHGSVQECPHCAAYMDVGEPADSEDWGSEEEDEE